MIDLKTFNKILITIILLLIILILIIIYNTVDLSKDNNKYIIFKHIFLEDIILDIKPGDLLLFSSYEYSNYTRILGNKIFSHIGIIIKDNDLYSLEMIENDYVFPKHSTFKNINKFNLIDRITHYPGFVYIASLINPLTNLQEQTLTNISNLEIIYPSFKENVLKMLINKGSDYKQHCSEFIGNIITYLNIYDLSNISKLNYHNSIIKICNGHIYTEPIRLITKKNITDNILTHNYIEYC